MPWLLLSWRATSRPPARMRMPRNGIRPPQSVSAAPTGKPRPRRPQPGLVGNRHRKASIQHPRAILLHHLPFLSLNRDFLLNKTLSYTSPLLPRRRKRPPRRYLPTMLHRLEPRVAAAAGAAAAGAIVAKDLGQPPRPRPQANRRNPLRRPGRLHPLRRKKLRHAGLTQDQNPLRCLAYPWSRPGTLEESLFAVVTATRAFPRVSRSSRCSSGACLLARRSSWMTRTPRLPDPAYSSSPMRT